MSVPRIDQNGYLVPIHATRPAPAWRDIRVQTLESCWGINQPCWACGRAADYMVIRTSNLTDRSYSDPACSSCAAHWADSEQCVDSDHPSHLVRPYIQPALF